MTEELQTPNRVAEPAGRIFFVSPAGNDENAGSVDAPVRTIGAAAALAYPGDTIEVGDGVYRERVDPPRGGTDDNRRIAYRAAAGCRPVITGSEVVTGWTHAQHATWKAVVPNSLFGDFNPFADVVNGDWYNGRGRIFHTGCVYLDGDARVEARDKDVVLEPLFDRPLWFAEVGDEDTQIWAQFDRDPNDALVEINVRRTIFYPAETGVDYLTVSGFELRHAATPWAPPTAEQIGAIGTNWSKGWIIERNHVHHSRCSGIALGKHGDEFDNRSANAAEGYVATIERAHDRGWSKDRIGHHLVRNNHVEKCGQAGLVGSMGCAFSIVTGNLIHDIHLMEHFSGAEEAGIKFHGAIDTDISGNHVYRTRRGIWLDWMAQGAHVSRNLLHDNASEDVYLEVNHGPCLVANNLLLSNRSLKIESTGNAFVHNLLAGTIAQAGGHGRSTPYLAPHSTEVTKLGPVAIGDDRWFNNLILGAVDMIPYDWASMPVIAEDNVYSALAIPLSQERLPRYIVEPFAAPTVSREGDEWHLTIDLPTAAKSRLSCKPVTSDRLGNVVVPRLGGPQVTGQQFKLPDGSQLALDTDYLGAARSMIESVVGPFAEFPLERIWIKVW